MPNVFNPYRDVCEVHDDAQSPLKRRQNLEALLQKSIEYGTSTIWFARDLGYLGGRRTGVALTDEVHLKNHSNMFPDLKLSKATTGPVQGERTANMTWDYLDQLKQPVFLWNIFPFHPHEEGNQFTNRCHTKKERQEINSLLDSVLGILQPKNLIAIGNDAALGLVECGYDPIKVRHPSYGGKADFIRGLNSIYDMPIQINRQKELALL